MKLNLFKLRKNKKFRYSPRYSKSEQQSNIYEFDSAYTKNRESRSVYDKSNSWTEARLNSRNRGTEEDSPCYPTQSPAQSSFARPPLMLLLWLPSSEMSMESVTSRPGLCFWLSTVFHEDTSHGCTFNSDII